MAVALPLVAAFATGAVSAVAAGTATLAAYATVAGAVLSTVGAITKNKHLSLVGAVVGLGGGLASLSTGMSTAAANGANAAGGAAGAANAGAGAGAAGGEWANTAFTSSLGTNAPTAALDTASFASRAAGTAQQPMNMATAFSDAAAAGAPTVARSFMEAANPLSVGTAATPIPSIDLLPPQTAGLLGPDAAPSYAFDAPDSPFGQGRMSNALGEASARAPTDALSRAASEMTGDTLQGFLRSPSGQSAFNEWLKKAGNGAKSIGDFVKQNKELVQMGGTALSSMFGPNAQMARLQEQQMERQRSLFDMAHRNMNSVVPLVYLPGGGR